MRQFENISENREQIEKFLVGMGATFIGFSNVADKLDGGLAKANLNYAVTVGLRLSDAVIDEIDDKPTYTYFHHYRTVNALLDQIALRGLLFIQQQGYNAMAVPASQSVNNRDDPYCGIFSHKIAAVMAGLGSIGKNNLFLHNEYGPRVRLATILTDMPLAERKDFSAEYRDGSGALPAGKPEKKGRCGSCDLCVKACPAMALSGKEWHEGAPREEIVDAKACSDYMNKNFKHIGRGYVCGICIKVCPAHKNRIGKY